LQQRFHHFPNIFFWWRFVRVQYQILVSTPFVEQD
jgi:hypothetical protein